MVLVDINDQTCASALRGTGNKAHLQASFDARGNFVSPYSCSWRERRRLSASFGVVRGTLTNGASTMPWWEVDVYPVDNRGVPLTELVLTDERTQLPAGATWDFETPAYDADFSDALSFVRHAGAK